jgi:hypothetical protein
MNRRYIILRLPTTLSLDTWTKARNGKSAKDITPYVEEKEEAHKQKAYQEIYYKDLVQ